LVDERIDPVTLRIILKIVIFLMLLQTEQMHKMTSISLKMVEVAMLSFAQLVTTVIFFLA
jgi:hypothetical protein